MSLPKASSPPSTPGSAETKPSVVFYGWRIVAVAFVTHCLTTGTVFYAFGVFFHPLSQHFGWSRADVSLGFSMTSISGALLAPLLGRVIDRYGPRPVQMFGAAMLGVGFVALAGVGSRLQYLLCMAIPIALGSTALGPMSSNAAVARWFVRRRGRALGIATAGISMGGVVFVPLTQVMVDRLGWRGAFLALGAIVAAVGIPPVVLWMRRSPEEVGLLPDGEPPRRDVDVSLLDVELERSLTAREAVRTRNFWLLALAFALTISGLSAVLLHQTPYLIDHGMDPVLAAWVLGGTAGIGVVGKLGFGALIDRFDQRRVVLLCFLLQAIGVSLLFFAVTPAMLVVYVVVYGYAMGGNATLQATLLGECFGRLHYGSIAGRMSPIIVTIQAVGVPFVGWLRDTTEHYESAFVVVILATVVASVAIGNVRLAPRRA